MEPSPEDMDESVEVEVTTSIVQFDCEPPTAPKTPANIVIPKLIRKTKETSGTSIFKKTTFFTVSLFLPQA